MGQLRSRPNAELGVDPRQVRLDGADGDEQLCRHLLVGQTAGDELRHLRFGRASGLRAAPVRRHGQASWQRAATRHPHRARQTSQWPRPDSRVPRPGASPAAACRPGRAGRAHVRMGARAPVANSTARSAEAIAASSSPRAPRTSAIPRAAAPDNVGRCSRSPRLASSSASVAASSSSSRSTNAWMWSPTKAMRFVPSMPCVIG